MGLEFVFSDRAFRDLDRLEKKDARRIVKKVAWFSRQANPLTWGKPLVDFKIGDYRFRIGDYRVLVVWDRKARQLIVISVGHRREIYRR